MTELAPVLVHCVLCRHPMSAQIGRRIRDHGIAPTIRWMEENGFEPIPHRNTFSTHKREHLTEPHAKALADATAALEKQSKTIRPKSGDLAQLVRDNVFARVTEGELEPSLSEGLRAQEMLDKRAEKGADRDMMIVLAGLLSGATQPLALLGDGAIEGEWRDVTERNEDERGFTALLGATADG